MKWNKIHTGLIILWICIIALIVINNEAFMRYQESNRKERLFISLTEWIEYYFKLYLLVPEVIALVMILVSHKEYKGTFLFKFSISSFFLALILTILPIWWLLALI